MTTRPDGARRGKPDRTGRSSGKMAGRAGKLIRPPDGEPWIWLTRELLESDAWRSLSKPARKLIDFLLIEHMNHAGTMNGDLKATHRQLANFGISERTIASAICEAEAVGLVDCRRGRRHIASTYALTFYPLADGTPASDRWRTSQNLKVCPHKCRQRAPTNAGKLGRKTPTLPPQMQAKGAPTNAGTSISRKGASVIDIDSSISNAPTASANGDWPGIGYELTGPQLAALCAASGHTVKSFARRVGVDGRKLRRNGTIDFGDDITATSCIDQMRRQAKRPWTTPGIVEARP